jgi:predicted RNA binding protein YcfA (HicA-like mRNA interferase family)
MSDGQLPILRPGDLIGALERMGFLRIRKSRGSHVRFGHADGRKTTVPVHRGKTIGRGLLRKILKDVGICIDELIGFL